MANYNERFFVSKGSSLTTRGGLKTEHDEVFLAGFAGDEKEQKAAINRLSAAKLIYRAEFSDRELAEKKSQAVADNAAKERSAADKKSAAADGKKSAELQKLLDAETKQAGLAGARVDALEELLSAETQRAEGAELRVSELEEQLDAATKGAEVRVSELESQLTDLQTQLTDLQAAAEKNSKPCKG